MKVIEFIFYALKLTKFEILVCFLDKKWKFGPTVKDQAKELAFETVNDLVIDSAIVLAEDLANDLIDDSVKVF